MFPTNENTQSAERDYSYQSKATVSIVFTKHPVTLLMLTTAPRISKCQAGLLVPQDTTVVVSPPAHGADRAASRDYGASLKLL